MSVFFISGIDTGIGKTVVTGLIARFLRKNGKKVITHKMVQTGNTGHSEDIDLHREIMEVKPFPEDWEFLTAPQIFTFPASPHLAAAIDRRPLDLNRITDSVKELEKRFDFVLVEGAGGLAVPLTEDLLTVDFAAQQGWPLILITSGRLGSLNHTILSIEAATSRKMRIAGVVYNHSPGADPLIENDSERMIRKYLLRYGQPDIVVRTPFAEKPWPDVDFSPIFGRLT